MVLPWGRSVLEPRDRIEPAATDTTECVGSFYRARYYDPARSRFISEDPFGLAAKNANLFAYTLNNPVGFIDPLGTLPLALAPLVLPILIPAAEAALGATVGLLSGMFLAEAISRQHETSGSSARSDDCPQNDCKQRLTDWQVDQLPESAHEIKYREIGKRARVKLYDLCGCKNGDVVIRLKGCVGPIIPTGYRL